MYMRPFNALFNPWFWSPKQFGPTPTQAPRKRGHTTCYIEPTYVIGTKHGKWFLRVELPRVSKRNIFVAVERHTLTIIGRRGGDDCDGRDHSDSSDDGTFETSGRIRSSSSDSERRSGSMDYMLVLRLRDEYDAAGIYVKEHVNGLITVALPGRQTE